MAESESGSSDCAVSQDLGHGRIDPSIPSSALQFFVASKGF